MGYRVINLKTKEDITDKFEWVITPDGKLFFLDGEDLKLGMKKLFMFIIVF